MTATQFVRRRDLLGLTLLGAVCARNSLWADGLAPRSDLDDLYTAAVDAAQQRGIGYLIKQLRDGRILQGPGPARNPGVAGLIGLSLLSVGGQPGRPPLGESLDMCLTYVLSCAADSGFIHDAASHNYGPMYEHGFASLMLAECYGASSRTEVRPILEDAVDLIIRTQNDRGGWRYHPAPTDADLSVTVCQMMALRAARNAGFYVPAETVARAVDYIRRCQNPDGGFAYQVTGGPSRWPLTAAAIVALQNAGAYEDAAIDRGYEYLLHRRRDVAIPSQTNYFFYAHYYAIQAFWQRGGDAWTSWYRELRDTLLRLQTDDGSWLDYVGRSYGTAMACLVLSVPRSILPIFQR